MENPATSCQTAKELFHSGFPQDALQRLRIGLEETPDAGQIWELYGFSTPSKRLPRPW